MNRLQRTFIFALSIALVSESGLQAAPPQNRWHRAGKSVHPQARLKKGNARNSYCTTACKKAGAKKPADLGACKESCVFG